MILVDNDFAISFIGFRLRIRALYLEIKLETHCAEKTIMVFFSVYLMTKLSNYYHIPSHSKSAHKNNGEKMISIYSYVCWLNV